MSIVCDVLNCLRPVACCLPHVTAESSQIGSAASKCKAQELGSLLEKAHLLTVPVGLARAGLARVGLVRVGCDTCKLQDNRHQETASAQAADQQILYP